MAALHQALQTLSPVDWSDVPVDNLKPWMEDTLSNSQLLVDSVPASTDSNDKNSKSRNRSNTTTSFASSASEVSTSSISPLPPHPDHAPLQKEWGKPIKLKASENPLGIPIYKLSAKDGKGAWFARRSVHEGMSYAKWKHALQREFPETLEVQGGPGAGSIRGIGGERRVEEEIVEGVGKLEVADESVYHLSAQFPGPTTPRDFVALRVSSETALRGDTATESIPEDSVPRHYVSISKPCIHPDCPPRDGFIRGQYESIEFIREVPVQVRRSSSTTDLVEQARSRADTDFTKDALLRNARSRTFPPHTDSPEEEKRKRGKTISFAESRGKDAKGEQRDLSLDDEPDEPESGPVEWIMITRSDPGGSVPRWMVERGTPAGIATDAYKFVDWAAKKTSAVVANGRESKPQSPPHKESGLRNTMSSDEDINVTDRQEELPLPGSSANTEPPRNSGAAPGEPGILSSVTNTVTSTLETYAPAVVINHLPGHQDPVTSANLAANDLANPQESTSQILSPTSSTASFRSFESAEEDIDSQHDFNSTASTTSVRSPSNSTSKPEKEIVKLDERRQKLDEKLAASQEKAAASYEMEKAKKEADEAGVREKEKRELKRLEEKHQREVQKQEEKYKKEMRKIEEKRRKEEEKIAAKARKEAEKVERIKLVHERDDARRELAETKKQLEAQQKESELLQDQVGELQRENTVLVARLGRMVDDIKRVSEDGGGNLHEAGLSKEAVMGSLKEGVKNGTSSPSSSMTGKEFLQEMRSSSSSKSLK